MYRLADLEYDFRIHQPVQQNFSVSIASATIIIARHSDNLLFFYFDPESARVLYKLIVV
jgi:hypothetical protein